MHRQRKGGNLKVTIEPKQSNQRKKMTKLTKYLSGKSTFKIPTTNLLSTSLIQSASTLKGITSDPIRLSSKRD